MSMLRRSLTCVPAILLILLGIVGFFCTLLRNAYYLNQNALIFSLGMRERKRLS